MYFFQTTFSVREMLIVWPKELFPCSGKFFGEWRPSPSPGK